jgi:hypothetical protein
MPHGLESEWRALSKYHTVAVWPKNTVSLDERFESIQIKSCGLDKNTVDFGFRWNPLECVLTYDRIKRSFLVLEVGIYEYISMSEILSRILGGIIVSISILDIIFSTDFHFGYQ